MLFFRTQKKFSRNARRAEIDKHGLLGTGQGRNNVSDDYVRSINSMGVTCSLLPPTWSFDMIRVLYALLPYKVCGTES